MNWSTLYKKTQMPRIGKVFIAFNTNIDYIKHINKKFIRQVNNKKTGEINTLTDLYRGIKETIQTGHANEWEIKNKNVYKKIKQLGYDKKRIGGQAGIVSNLLAELNAEKIVLYTPLLSKKQADYINKEVLIPRNGKLIPVRKAYKADETRINCIFEIDEIKNRFIASYHPKNNEPILSERELPLLKDINKAFVSGYQSIRERETYAKALKQIKEIKKINPKIKMHMELTNVEDKTKLRKILKLAQEFNSVGLNETELKLCLRTFNKDISDYSLQSLINGVLILIKKLKTDRIHLHTHHNYVTITKKEFATEEQTITSLINASKYIGGKAPISDIGIKRIEKITLPKLEKYYITIIATKMIKNIKTTVGLGDKISAISFLTLKTF